MIQPGEEPVPGYRVEQLLGRGQYGEVWRASSPGRSQVALKFLDLRGRAGWKEFRATQRVKQIRHANLLPIVALWLVAADGRVLTDDDIDRLSRTDPSEEDTLLPGEQEGPQPSQLVIATPLADGSLRDRLNACQAEGQTAVPVDELVRYMEEAAKGLDHLNAVGDTRATGSGAKTASDSALGVQHCDIKPDNLMLTGGSVQIGDFGVAQFFADDGGVRATSLSGSPAYMPPEAFESMPDAASDQYSLAVTYHELRTGRLPFEATDFAGVYDAHRSGTLDFSSLTPAEAAVLRRATRRDPAGRFASAGAFAAALREAVHGKPRRRGLPVAAAVLAAAVLAAGAGVWYATRLGPPPEQVLVTLRLGRPGDSVMVNGSEYVADADGQIVVETPAGSPLLVRRPGDADFRATEWTFSSDELSAGGELMLNAKPTAANYARRSREAGAARRVEEQVKNLAEAVRLDPDRFARLPAAVHRETVGVLWDTCVAVTDEELVAGGRDGVVRQWRLGDAGLAEAPRELQAHRGASILSIARRGEWAASACDRGAVWLSRGEAVQRIAPPRDFGDTAVALVGPDRWLVVAEARDLQTAVKAWRLDGTAKPVSLGVQPGEFPRVIAGAESSLLLATRDERAVIWKWSLDPPSHEPVAKPAGEVLAMAASADGTTAAYAGSLDPGSDGRWASIIRLPSGERVPLAGVQADSILALAVSDDGDALITAERGDVREGQGGVRVWTASDDGQSFVCELGFPFDAERGDATALALSADSNWIAAGHANGAMSVWGKYASDDTPITLAGGSDRVAAIRITPDSRWLIALGRDGRITLLDLRRLGVVLRACQKAGVEPRPAEESAA